MEKEKMKLAKGTVSDLHNGMAKLLGMENNCECKSCRIRRLNNSLREDEEEEYRNGKTRKI